MRRKVVRHALSEWIHSPIDAVGSVRHGCRQCLATLPVLAQPPGVPSIATPRKVGRSSWAASIFSSERNNQKMSNDATNEANQDLDEFEQRLLAHVAELQPDEPNGTPSVVSTEVVAGLSAIGVSKMTTSVDLAAMKAISEQAAINQNGNRYLKLEGEETRVRILPPRIDMHGVPSVEKNQHYISGKYTDCLGEQDCPICRRMRTLQAAQPDKESQNKVWKKYGASKSHLYNVAVGGEVKILSATSGLHKRIVSAFLNAEVGDMTDPVNGYDFLIRRVVGATGMNDYTPSDASRRSTPLENADSLFSSLYDLTAEAAARQSRQELEAIAATMQ